MKVSTKVRGTTNKKLNIIKEDILLELSKTCDKKPVTTTSLLRFGTYEEVMTIMSELKKIGKVAHSILNEPGRVMDGLWWKNNLLW